MENFTYNIADDTVIEPLKLISKKLRFIERDFFLEVPNIVAALLLLIFAYWLAKLAKVVVCHMAHTRQRGELGTLLGQLSTGIIYVLAALFAAAIVFPTIGMSSVFSTLGIGSVAIGFAFKDILQNLLSGVLIVLHRPYLFGDVIRVRDMEGTVIAIESRVTVLRTDDGKKLLIPNSEIYTSPVTVLTAYDTRQDQFSFHIDQSRDADILVKQLVDALSLMDIIHKERPPNVAIVGFTTVSTELLVSWWGPVKLAERLESRSAIVAKIIAVAHEHGVKLNPDAPLV